MRFLNFFEAKNHRNQKNQRLKLLLSLFFIFLIVLNFLYFNENLNFTTLNEGKYQSRKDATLNLTSPIKEASIDTSMLQDPFTKNFNDIQEFFITKYKSSLDYNISTYYRFGDTDGLIVDDTIFSEDNLLLYKSLLNMELNNSEIFNAYLQLKETPLWYKSIYDQNEYGFVKSIDNTTGLVQDSNRYLIDNLIPIFLLIENIGNEIDDISINGELPTDSIDEMFNLINSTEFWDASKKGFYNSNLSDTKDVESNFYSILANLLIHRTYRTLNLNSTIRNRAYELANQTMIALNSKMWDSVYDAFRHDANDLWDSSGPGQSYYHLSVNALGITTLLEFWIETGMESNSSYYQQAIDLYKSISMNTRLWNDTNHLYMNVSKPDWSIEDKDIDLKANAMMMSACLKLFEVTGNITYYDRAMEIFNSTEFRLFDNINNVYNSSLISGDKLFNYNLKLSEAYQEAYDIYSSTILPSEYNLSSQVPDFIFNQDVMNLTSIYKYEKTQQFFDPLENAYKPFTITYNITNADITYLFKYPNGSFLDQLSYQILDPDNTHTLLYNIEETLPINQGYYVYVWANTSYFRMSETLKHFNVFSGLKNMSVEGIYNTFFQGPIINVSVLINYTREDNLTLTATLEGVDIVSTPAQIINFTASEEIRISFNLTAKIGTSPGPSEIFFRIKKGNILYLEIKKIIEIGYSFDYSNLLYQSQVVSGDNIYVSMNLINFLPNASQILNISFMGISENSIEYLIREETLLENEIKTVSYNLKSFELIKNEIISIKMSILINTTEYYAEIFTVEMIPKYEIKSVSFPGKIPQGTEGYLIIIIQNNQRISEEFSLLINGKVVQANLNELVPGENRILKKVIPTLNPYEFGKKTYQIVLKDSLDQDIARFYFEVELELSTLNLVLFYVLPIMIPVGIILYFLNKDIKHKKLRR